MTCREARGRRLAGLLLGLLLGLAVAGCGRGGSPQVAVGPGGTPDPVLVAGRAVFADRCASCHDADGSGTGNGPRLNRGRLVQEYPSLDDAATVVSEGRGRMPGFGTLLSPNEIDAVLRYISEVL